MKAVFKSLLLIIFFLTCSKEDYTQIKYKGKIDLTKYPWLKEKKIFIDPGHGGFSHLDKFRQGPSGSAEEEINLRVAHYLYSMLIQAGARPAMSRYEDECLTLDERVKKALVYEPDLLISIHHNGSILSKDNINYPSIIFHGNKEQNPASYQFAEILLPKLEKIIHKKGNILSDYAIFWETGVYILRKTRHICPGILGEGGFFTHPEFELKLKTSLYNQKEAEAYFLGIANYFKKGLPCAEILKKKNQYFIKIDSGTKKQGIEKNSLSVKINDLPLKTKKISTKLYQILLKKLTPGSFKISLYFKNKNSQNSMHYYTNLYIPVKKGQYKKLIKKGISLIEKENSIQKGLLILSGIYKYLITDPLADKITWNIAWGFEKLKNKKLAAYYYKRLYHFYPQSKYQNKIKKIWLNDYKIPLEFYGKKLEIIKQ